MRLEISMLMNIQAIVCWVVTMCGNMVGNDVHVLPVTIYTA